MKKRTQAFLQLGLFAGILIFINILGNTFYNYWDWTEDQRFTLTDETVDMMENMNEKVFVRILLEGDLGVRYQRLQKHVKELLDDYRSVNSNLEYVFENPLEGPEEEVKSKLELYYKSGIVGATDTEAAAGTRQDRLVFPYALIFFQGREEYVSLVEKSDPGVDPERAMNNSISLLEYKFTSKIKKIMNFRKPAVLYTTGHGELDSLWTNDFDSELVKSYDFNRINLDRVTNIDPKVDVLIVAKPVRPFSERDNFKIDQYIMNGGKVLWLVDKVATDIDSMRRTGTHVALPRELNLDNLLFKYGARIQPNLVMDLDCTPIQLTVGVEAGQEQKKLFPWYFYPRVAATSNHPIVKNLDRVNMFFPNRIDTIETRTGKVKKEILLASSKYSRYQRTPINLTFDILRERPDPGLFDKQNLPMAVLLEGNFPSAFENRVTESMLSGLRELNLEFKKISEPTRQIVVASGDIIKNRINPQTRETYPLGANVFDGYLYANKKFLMNCIDYLQNDQGIIQARGKDIKLRLLDTVRAEEEKRYWQFLNIGLPIIALGLFGYFYNWMRRRRFAGQ